MVSEASPRSPLTSTTGCERKEPTASSEEVRPGRYHPRGPGHI